jgi:hypothetical protein
MSATETTRDLAGHERRRERMERSGLPQFTQNKEQATFLSYK